MRQVKVPGSPGINVAVEGDGAELIVFLHGIGGNWRNWKAQLPVFGAKARAVAWDARGYGDSDDYDTPLVFADWVADVLRLVDHFGVARAHIVGLSIGGRVAQRFALAHPDRLASLVLADTRSETRVERTEEQRAAFYNARAKPILEGKTMAEIAPNVARSLMGPKAGPDVHAQLVDSMARIRRGAYLKAIAANLDEDYAGDLGAIRVPTLVIVGADDTLTPPALGRKLAADIAGAEYVEVPDAGHLSNIENPQAFNAALHTFYARHFPGLV
jgi:3-oxoadipate enol-lactonase